MMNILVYYFMDDALKKSTRKRVDFKIISFYEEIKLF
jgi:hypothetical protein